MYTLLHHQDGRVTLRTHVEPERLSPEDAGRLLDRLLPLLATLRRAADAREESSRDSALPDDAGSTALRLDLPVAVPAG